MVKRFVVDKIARRLPHEKSVLELYEKCLLKS
jgi:hypothetical protein